jgi:hypothetical protein
LKKKRTFAKARAESPRRDLVAQKIKFSKKTFAKACQRALYLRSLYLRSLYLRLLMLLLLLLLLLLMEQAVAVLDPVHRARVLRAQCLQTLQTRQPLQTLRLQPLMQ